ncbi:MAG: MBL fold metallo-hydrolase [Syntrophus sp. (in: bacteria)]|nr:MBL fold metallo-hydrolase [Syntrophus sp. (in: bacteria)]
MIKPICDNLHLIPLDLPSEGFHRFLGAWLYKNDHTVILVDPGPRSTMPALLQVLEEMNIRHIDHILLTHIHLDHAGGLGFLLDRYPDAKAICHPRGVQHLLKPDKLWEASRKLLGDTALLYGEPAPVPEKNLDFRRDFPAGEMAVKVYETPGHAPHHLCYRIGDMLFAGEAAGIFYPLAGNIYLRIAAPPGFDLHDYRRSLDILRQTDTSVLCFSHYGLSFETRRLLDMASAQTELWATVISKFSRSESALFEEEVFESLLDQDPGLSCFHLLPADVKKRETYFLGNSFRGFRIALNKKEDS